MNYTAEQQAAIDERERSVIVIAGAGSGKTRVLVDRFVGLLADHRDWPVSALVAITFTEKAARELRERIHTTVEARIANCETDADRSFWRGRAAELDSARIGTIHSLCATILRANAAWLTIDPAFSVLDESQAALIQESAIERTLIELTEHPVASQLFSSYSVRQLRERLGVTFGWNLLELPDPAATDPEALLAEWQDRYGKRLAALVTDLWEQSAFVEAVNWRPDPPIPDDHPDKIFQAWQTIRSAAYALYDERDPAIVMNLLTAIDETSLRGGSAKVWGQDFEVVKDHLKLIKATVQSLSKLLGDPIGDVDRLAAELTPAWLYAIHALHAHYSDLKTAARALDFDDLERLTRQVLSEESVIARYRGTEFKHVMIDEFQDTNAAQRDILIGLTGYAPGSLFVVGDPKQAIYGFRGAEATVFEEVAAAIRATGGLSITLNTSFRAHQALVALQNDLFGALFPHLPTSEVAMISPRPAEDHHVPAIEIMVLEPDNAPEKYHLADSMRAIEARLLGERLMALIAGALPIWDRAKGVYRAALYGDCAVLCRSHLSIRAVEASFKAAGIAYVTVGGQGFFSQEEVRDLTALLSALYNPADELALATALRSLLFALSDDALYALRLLYPGQSLWAALTGVIHSDQPDAGAVRFARESLLALRLLVERLSIADLLTSALDLTGFLAVLAGLPDGVRRVGNVQKLVDRAREAGPVSLGSFVDQLADASERELREGEVPTEVGNAVRLMTIHASKGLEFPIVAIFDTGKHNGRGSGPLLWESGVEGVGLAFELKSDEDKTESTGDKSANPFIYQVAKERLQAREQAESLRVWYVAVTRAADRLLISGKEVGPFSDKSSGWLARTIAVLIPTANLLTADPPAAYVPPAGTWTAQFQIPAALPLPLTGDAHFVRQPSETGWDLIRRGQPISVSPYQPPLNQPLPAFTASTPKALSATSIARLGQATTQSNQESRTRLTKKLRAELFHAAPPDLPDLAVTGRPNTDPRWRRIVGDVVHRALQFDLLNQPLESGALLETLGTYAWDLRITNDSDNAEIALEAHRLLLSINPGLSDLIGEADQVKRELPFTFRLGTRTISGQIDVLFLSRGKWTILDYKTDDVTGATMYSHAHRYYGQLGVYAAAVEQITGQPPRTVLYYIRPGRQVEIKQADWRAALERLSAELDRLANGSDIDIPETIEKAAD